jgi:hypothetical protein
MVESLYFVPEWFYNIDIILSILFVVITGLVAAHSFKVYQLSKEKTFKLFGISFIFLSLSYLLRMLLNIYLTSFADNTPGILRLLFGMTPYGEIIIYTYVLLFILGYLTLAYTTLKIKSTSAYFMLAALSIISIIASDDKSLVFYLIASIFLLFLTVHYFKLARQDKKSKGVRVIFASFLLLLISNIWFMFIGNYNFYYGYIISEIGEILAYSLIAVTMWKIIKDGLKIVKHGQKTKPA